ncbi:16S rRNA methyltransferase [Synechococcus sp. KORDI-52]|uniref:16S rRNA (cytosine(967)-C(5))-methyltransferase n=1 Tax=Synechococcus sp. KORDI-52 TaxID=585425 RepID=UPI0004E06F41|nr:16S rRNA (cytosine(967)-C(5))-methyltransferase [Synechococcus sp. KORDI-52]AII50026.1 16S rRNA methyltransferase [Synechococcus sp. KORDI-52]
MVHLSGSAPIGLLPRRLAWDVLQAVAAGAYADVALERVLRAQDLKPSDRGLVTELAYGAIRQRRTLDAWLDRLGRVPALKQPPKLRWLLHVGLYQLLLMERIPDSAAVNTAVELAKASKGLARLAPVVNGVLRAALRAREAGETLQLPHDAAAQLAQAHSLPDWFTQLLIKWRGVEGAAAVASACNRVPDLDLRVNRLCSSREEVQRLLAVAGISSSPLVGCPDGLRIAGHSGDLRQWPGYTEGQWCVQDCSAQWIAPLLDPQPGDRILDACAAPGGKATHLAELVGDQAEIWAVDRSPGRLKRVAANAARLGLASINALAADAANLLELRPQWRESFQRILIDAPCSGLGTLSRHPDARWRVTPQSIRGLLPQQQALLDGLVPLLAPAGSLVYATCTIHPDENQAQVQSVLKRHPMLHLQEESQRWPDQAGGGDGFYSAVFRRG